MQFSLSETEVAISSGVSGRAPVPDRIPNYLYKEDLKIWGPYINVLSNSILSGMEIPHSWKLAVSEYL